MVYLLDVEDSPTTLNKKREKHPILPADGWQGPPAGPGYPAV